MPEHQNRFTLGTLSHGLGEPLERHGAGLRCGHDVGDHRLGSLSLGDRGGLAAGENAGRSARRLQQGAAADRAGGAAGGIAVPP